MARKVWSPERNRKLLEMYESGTLATSEMARALNVTDATVYNHLRRMGLSTKDLPRRYRAVKKFEFSDQDKLRIIRLAEQGCKVNQIALLLNRSLGPTRRIFTELGLKTTVYKAVPCGTSFGALTVVGPATPERTYKGHLEHRSHVRCKCGKSKIVFNYNLRTGNTTSCGCRFQQRRPDRDWVRRRCDVASGARMRHLEMNLTTAQIKFLGLLNCTYCGTSSANQMKGRKNGRSTGETVLNYSGIDRLDASSGYFPGNVVPCCPTCNRAKSDLVLSSFIAWLTTLERKLQLILSVTQLSTSASNSKYSSARRVLVHNATSG